MNGHQQSSISLERLSALHIFLKGQKYRSLLWCWKARIDIKKPRSFYHLGDFFHEIFLRKNKATFGGSNSILFPKLLIQIGKREYLGFRNLQEKLENCGNQRW